MAICADYSSWCLIGSNLHCLLYHGQFLVTCDAHLFGDVTLSCFISSR